MKPFPLATGIFLALNAVVYLALAASGGSLDIDARTVAIYGGLMPLDIIDVQYWRFLTYGFVHFSLMHLMANAICLLAWGVPLERWFGAARMTWLYLGSIVLAGAGTIMLENGPFVLAGASGGVSGLLGALFLLWLMRIIDMPGTFFAINAGLNVAVALLVPGIGWQAHLTGALGGMALTALILLLRARRRPPAQGR